MSIVLSPDAVKLLSEPNPASIATIRPDGTTHLTPIWVDWDGEFVLINTVIGRAKHRHLQRVPHASVVVVDRADPTRYLSVAGAATLTTEGADDHIDALALKYMGVKTRAPRTEPANRIIVAISVDRVNQWNVDMTPAAG